MMLGLAGGAAVAGASATQRKIEAMAGKAANQAAPIFPRADRLQAANPGNPEKPRLGDVWHIPRTLLAAVRAFFDRTLMR